MKKDDHITSRLRELDALFDRQLKQLSGNVRSLANKPEISIVAATGKWLAVAVLGIVLPFIVLIRMAVYSYLQLGVNGWLALGVGMISTVLLLAGYFMVIGYRLKVRIDINRYVFQGLSILVLSYCLYAGLVLSATHTKNEAVREQYYKVHPVLRVATATLTLADGDLLVTDTERVPDDYLKMGLPVNGSSLHYVQPTGYIHAIDIRTLNRPEWKNGMLKLFFNLLGFETLRHTGTEDHLHIFIQLND